MTLELPADTTASIKSFWSRPEGKMAMLVLAGIVAVTALYGYSIILPYIVSLLVDTVHMMYLGLEIAALGYLIFSKRMHLFYRVIMRGITGIFVQLDPIAIIKDKLTQMKKRKAKMDEQIGEVKGQLVALDRAIDQNAKEALAGLNSAEFAKKRAATTTDVEEAERMRLQVAANARKAQRRKNSNIGFTALRVKLQRVYDFLVKYAAHIDFYIEDTSDEIRQKEVEYKTTSTAFGAMKMAMKVISGNAVEEDIYNQAFEMIEQDVSKKLGIMDDLTRVSQNFMDGMSVQEGAVDESALKSLEAFEQKLLTSGDSELEVMAAAGAPQKVPVGRAPIGSPISGGSSDYSDLLK